MSFFHGLAPENNDCLRLRISQSTNAGLHRAYERCEHASCVKVKRYVRWQDGTLRTTLWNILVLKRLSASEGVVFIKQGTLVDRIISVNQCQKVPHENNRLNLLDAP